MGYRQPSSCHAVYLFADRIPPHNSLRDAAVGARASTLADTYSRGPHLCLVTDVASLCGLRANRFGRPDRIPLSQQRTPGCYRQYGRDCDRSLCGGRLVLCSRAIRPGRHPLSGVESGMQAARHGRCKPSWLRSPLVCRQSCGSGMLRRTGSRNGNRMYRRYRRTGRIWILDLHPQAPTVSGCL